ncbi:MAG: carbohydrate-binding domain-containing protein [Propionibacteriaceae bacterium]|jgi:parallel beta-helix repeat protein
MSVRSVRLVLVSTVVASCAVAAVVPIALAGGGVSPATGQPPQMGSPTSHRLVLKISEDRYRGNAKYVVKVDGTRVGGIRTAHAAHRSGRHDVVRLKGHWGPGAHIVTVKFLNDRYGGTPRKDRNLYVDGATYDGKRVKGARQAIYSERRPAKFTVTDAVDPSPGRTPTTGQTAAPSATAEPSAATSVTPTTSTKPVESFTPAPTATGSSSSTPSDVRCTSTISPGNDIAGAVAKLTAGRTLCLTPGTYRLSDRLKFPADVSGSASSPATLAARDGLGSVTIDANGAEEALYFTGASHVIVTGLKITGGAYHGIKIDAPTSDFTIRDDAIFDNLAAGDSAQYSAVKGCCLAQRVTIEDSDIYYSHAGPGNNHQGIDCNGCKSWIVRGNHVHGIRSQEGGNAVQFKSGSADTIIENNVINDNFLGISFGGFGNPQQWGHEDHEHVRGTVRNNVIYGNDDAGISALDTIDGKIYNNTLYGNGFTPDVRRGAINLSYRNNILDRALNQRDGTTAKASDNYVLASPTNSTLFVEPSGGNFELKASATEVVDQGANLGSDVPTDIRGRSRPQGSGYDIGAYER